MIRVIISVIAVLCLLMTQAADAVETATLKVGMKLPQAAFADLRGNTTTFPEAMRGKVGVIHFWAVGCSSCKEEMPAMDRLYRAVRTKGVEITGINVGQSRKEVEQFSRSMDISFPLLLDSDKKSAKLYEVIGIPRTIILDRNGYIRFKIIGGVSADQLKKYVMSLLGG